MALGRVARRVGPGTAGAHARERAARDAQASGLALQAIAAAVPNLIGGSADLADSTGTALKQGGTFGPATTGRIIHWGVREHGMAACLNGIAAHGGVRAFGSTFLVFSTT